MILNSSLIDVCLVKNLIKNFMENGGNLKNIKNLQHRTKKRKNEKIVIKKENTTNPNVK